VNRGDAESAEGIEITILILLFSCNDNLGYSEGSWNIKNLEGLTNFLRVLRVSAVRSTLFIVYIMLEIIKVARIFTADFSHTNSTKYFERGFAFKWITQSMQ